MRGWQGVIAVLATVWLAVGLQQGLGDRALWGMRPDFPAVATLALGWLLPRGRAAGAGFALGLCHGALTGANLAAYAISRTMAGFGLAWFAGGGWKRTTILVGLTGALGYAAAQLAFGIIAPPTAFGSFAADTIRGAVLNGFLTMGLYSVLSKLLLPPRR